MTAQLDLKSGEEQDLFQKIREHPEQLSAYRRLARVLAKRNRCDDAAAVLRQAARRDPDDRETRVLLAQVYENAGRLPEAARVLRALIKRGTARFLPYERLARVYKKQGRRAAVAPVLEAVPGDSPVRERALKKLVEVYKEEGKWRPALAAAERLIAEFGPEFGRVKNRARLLDRLNRPEEAIAAYRQAGRLNPENPDVPFLLGLCQKRSGDRKGARKTFLDLTGIRHGYYGGNMQLAEMDIDDGDLEAAEERLKKLDARWPGNSRVNLNRARIMLAKGREAEALETARANYRLTPFYYTDELALGYETMAEAMKKTGTKGPLPVLYRRLGRRLRRGGDYFKIVADLIEELLKKKRFEMALLGAEELLERFPDNSLGCSRKAEALKLLGRKTEAVDFARRAASERDPRYLADRLRGLRLLEELHREEGRGEEAAAARREAQAAGTPPARKGNP